jgi:hypothetical protein
VPWAALALAAIGFTFIKPLKDEFFLSAPDLAGEGGVFGQGVRLIVAAWWFGVDTGGAFGEVARSAFGRLSHLITFAWIIEMTPEPVPYWAGETYLPILYKLVPRFLFPDKPMEVIGQAFGHRYELLWPLDLETAVNLPQLVEFYANFGVPGVLLGMFIVGLGYRAFEAVFVHREMGLGALVAGVHIASRLLMIEANLSGVVGGIFWSLVLLTVLHPLMRGRSRRRAAVKRDGALEDGRPPASPPAGQGVRA